MLNITFLKQGSVIKDVKNYSGGITGFSVKKLMSELGADEVQMHDANSGLWVGNIKAIRPEALEAV